MKTSKNRKSNPTLDTLLAKVEEFNQKQEEIKKQCADLFKDVMSAIFSEYPTLQTISWKQYTPGYNDGEHCMFCRNIDDVYLNGVDQYGDIIDSDEEDTIYCPNDECAEEIGEAKFCPECGTPNTALTEDGTVSDPLTEEVYEIIQKVMASFDESVYSLLFTDENLRVTIKRDGSFDSQYYDCGY